MAIDLEFTGERMIPDKNRGKALYFEHLERYIFASQFVKNKNVLDVGCGTGYGAYILKKSGANSVYAIDKSSEVIDYAKELFSDKKIYFQVGDVEDLKIYKKRFNMIVAFEILEHLRDQNKFILKLRQNLSQDGILCISTPNKLLSHHVNPFHTKEFSPSQFRAILKKFFNTFIF